MLEGVAESAETSGGISIPAGGSSTVFEFSEDKFKIFGNVRMEHTKFVYVFKHSRMTDLIMFMQI